MTKERIIGVIEMFLVMLLTSFVIWLFSLEYSISLIWILSPFWMLLAYLLSTIILIFIKLLFSILIGIIQAKKGNTNEHSVDSKTNG